jgi:hypothetical protein
MLSRCFGRGCRKSPSPSPPNLPANIIRKIAQSASPRTVRSMARATGHVLQGSRTSPIGLAAGRVGRSIVSVPRRPVVNRSRATAKTPRITRGSANPVDTVVPQAYKNNHWKYYSKVARHLVIFLNTPKGDPFTFNKQGRRVNVTPNLLTRHGVTQNWRRVVSLRERRKNFHTWGAYQKRLEAFRRLPKSTLNRALEDIDNKVRRYVQGDIHALDDVPLSRLIYWANMTTWMQANGTPYVRNMHTKKWHRYGSNEPLNKYMIMNNIELMNSMR